MKEVTIYTDGSCLNNGQPDAPGGWAAVLIGKKNSREIHASAVGATNNRMELQAVIESLKYLTEPCDVTIVTDSEYAISALTKVDAYEQMGWGCHELARAKNKDLLQEYLTVRTKKGHKIRFQYVRSHSGNAFNERADALAQAEARAAQAMQRIQVIEDA